MPLKKYEPIFSEINAEIDRFNGLLAEPFRIPPIKASNSEEVAVIANVPWDDQTWGQTFGVYPGVYLLFGYQENAPLRLGLRVGKASFGESIGKRLWRHLRYQEPSGIHRICDRFGEPFIIEAIIVVALRNPQTIPLAVALEEALIHGLRERVYLLNKVGNLKGGQPRALQASCDHMGVETQ